MVIGDITEDWATETAEAIRAAGGRAIGVYLDGTKAASQAAIVQAALDEFGGLDFYRSNLAGGTEGDIDALNCPEEVLDRSFAINTKSHMFATQAALPVMLERGSGAMIYTSSGAANGICPGVVLTEAVKQHLSDEYVEAALKTVPHTRLGKGEDIAGAVAFLASDDGEWVNGQVWHVNGGMIKRD